MSAVEEIAPEVVESTARDLFSVARTYRAQGKFDVAAYVDGCAEFFLSRGRHYPTFQGDL